VTLTIPSLVEFATDPQWLGLSNLSLPQYTILRAIDGEPPASQDERDTFFELTGRRDWPAKPPGDVTIDGGSRSGKTSILEMPTGLYQGIFGGHERYLARGERGIIPVIFQDAKASAVGGGYLNAYLESSPLLKSAVDDVTQTEIRLKNRITFMRFPCTGTSLRGWSIPCALMDELGSWSVEGMANADVEIVQACRRGMVQFPNSLLLKVSTPWLKQGVLWDDFQAAWGKPDPDRLVFKAPSWLLNPTLVGRLERERRLDPRRFSREYAAEFADALLESLLTADAIDLVTPRGIVERAPDRRRTSVVHLDMATGIGKDAAGIAVATDDGVRAILQAVRHFTPPFSVSDVIGEVADLCRRYDVPEVTVDKYAPGLVLDLLAQRGIDGRIADADTSKAFLGLLMLVNTRGCSLLDSRVLRAELIGLMRQPAAGGKDIVSHGRNGHDDLAAAVAQVLTQSAHAMSAPDLDLLGSAYTSEAPMIEMTDDEWTAMSPEAQAAWRDRFELVDDEVAR
jgi:hypothetical protein